MSDFSISIVPRLSAYPEPETRAAAVLAWLVAQRIVAAPPSDCLLGPQQGYAPGPGAAAVVQEPRRLPWRLQTNGLELTTERRIFDSGGNDVEAVICPRCRTDIKEYDWDFLAPWAEGEADELCCPHCGAASSVHAYRFVPAWGFSNLGFTFWNWPAFTEAFLADFGAQLGCAVEVVHCSL